MKTEIMNALIERVETLSDEMLNRNIHPIKAKKELEEITEEASKLDKLQEIQVMASLAKLAQTLKEEQDKRKKEYFEKLENMSEEELEEELKNSLVGFLKAMKAGKNNTKCDGDCGNCSTHSEKMVGITVNLDELDEEERKEIIESTKGDRLKHLNITVNEYKDAKEVVIKEKVSKAELFLIVNNLRKDLRMGLLQTTSAYKKDNENNLVLLMRYAFGKNIVIDFTHMGMDKDEVDQFCDSFIEKYLA